MDRLATANLRSEPQSDQFLGSAELTPAHNTTISAIAILNPFRLNHCGSMFGGNLMLDRNGVKRSMYGISLTRVLPAILGKESR